MTAGRMSIVGDRAADTSGSATSTDRRRAGMSPRAALARAGSGAAPRSACRPRRHRELAAAPACQRHGEAVPASGGRARAARAHLVPVPVRLLRGGGHCRGRTDRQRAQPGGSPVQV
eukprot:scaffold2516_cov108-Isochrysis_galbana.AAC.8